jgi:IS5 family transposase
MERKSVVYADAGYQGLAKRPKTEGKAIDFRDAMRPGQRRASRTATRQTAR